jgi:hypothetical protein
MYVGYYDNVNQDLDKFLDDELGPVLTKKGTVRKRKPKQQRMYFTQDTEDAILEYVKADDQRLRNEIYDTRIAYSFYKLAENIIHTFKFYYTDTDTIEELKHEVIAFLLEKLSLYHHSKHINDRLRKIIVREYKEQYVNGSFQEFTGNSPVVTQEQINEFISNLNVSADCLNVIDKLHPPKAYSYFGTIVKRYLIIYNDKNYKKLQDKADISEVNEEDEMFIDKNNEEEKTEMSEFMDIYINFVNNNLYKLFPKKNDAKTADAIIELFRRRDTLEIFNKKALYIYIREITDVDTPQITKIIKKLKVIYAKMFNEYYEKGFVKV